MSVFRAARLALVIMLALAACTHARDPGGGPTAAPVTPPTRVTTSAPPAAAPLPERYDPSRNAAADIAAVRALAARDHREVLLDFGADWCPDCVVLHRLLATPTVQAVLRAHYHLLSVDVGEFDHNLDIAGRYVNLTDAGIPALAVLTPTGTLRFATNDGSFADARTMTPAQVRAFLLRWAG